MAGSTAESAGGSLLERESELERLDAALSSAKDGVGTLVLMEGAAGIGKTALVTSAQRRADALGFTVASARGSELEREFAFGMVRQLLEPLLIGGDTRGREELFAGAAALAKPLLRPAAAHEAAPELVGDKSFSILHGLYWLCANLAQSGPLLLAVDDAQWADLASLRFFTYLAPRLDDLPLALLVAKRPPEGNPEAELLTLLAHEPRAIAIEPSPLTADAVAALVAAQMDRPPDPEFAAACRQATGGVPLLVRELVRALGERDVEPVAASVPRVEEIGPKTVAGYVVARVRRLAPEAEPIARAISVLGSDAELHRVFKLAGISDEDAGVHALDALVLAGVISPSRPFEFTHPILRAAIYAELAPGERSRMHEGAAMLLIEERVAEERIATHLLATSPRGDPKGVDVLVRTAQAAFAHGAPRSAVAYLERALAEPPPADVRGHVLHQLGVAHAHSGQPEHAIAHLREAFRLAGGAGERARIAQDLAGYLRLQWDYEEALQVTAEALKALDPEDDLALALRAELVLTHALEPTAAIGTGYEAERWERPPPRRTIGTAKYLSALITDATMRLARPAVDVRELTAAARDAGIVEDLRHGGSLWINAVAPAVIADGYSLAEQMLEEAFAVAGKAASIVAMTRAHVTRSLLRLRQGALAEAMADAETALRTVSESGFYFSLLSLAVLAEACSDLGTPQIADEAFERLGLQDEMPDTFVHNWVLHGRGRLRLAQRRIDDAIADLEELGLRNDHRKQVNPGVQPQRSSLAIALLARGDADRARDSATAELELSRRWGAPRAIGVSLNALGVCIGGADGIAYLRESTEVLDGSGAHLEHARSLVELGAATRRQGNRADAREPLRAGMEIAHRCGAMPLVERAREELLATGARPRRIVRTGVDALTPSELRVARMAADGLTNREIAQALFVTPRTVEGHLTHAFQKLDIPSREQLGDELGAHASG